MPSNFSSLDTGFPNLSGMNGTEQKLRAIQDYLVQLLEQLRYTLNNLGAENFNETSLVDIGKTITEPINVKIDDVENDLSTRISINADGIESEVSRASAAEESLSTRVTQTAEAISTEVSRSSAAEGSLSTRITQTAEAITAEASRATAAEGSLSTRVTQNATAITTEVTRASDAEGNLSSKIDQTAEGIKLDVKGNYAAEWASDHGVYYQYDVVKVTTTSGGQVTNVQYYRASNQHTAAANNKPGTTGGGSYWVEISNTTTQAMIDLNLRGISLSYNNQMVGSSEWASGTSYLKDAVVSVTVGTVALYYKAKQNHTASASNKPGTSGGANYWDSTTEPNEHNASYILLNKDGVSIGGGKVFIKDLDADTIVAGSISADRISAGTLNAGIMNMLGKFTVQAEDQNGVVHDCGTIGGYAIISDPDDPSLNEYTVYFGTQDSDVQLYEHKIIILSAIWNENTHSTDQCSIIITPNSIQIAKRENGTTKTVDLFNLEQRVTALENA